MVAPPPGRHFVAASFPILQEDESGDTKVRRGEDWRRAGHNSTVRAYDVRCRIREASLACYCSYLLLLLLYALDPNPKHYKPLNPINP